LEAAAFGAELSTTRDEAAAAPWRQRLGVFAQASRN
ncbi:MAG: hypothetical protein QOD44_566, partial [Solirubrobacteraceae bacterium]|nr:hypothetical protein [Solirubrobacteraceae bacterium]